MDTAGSFLGGKAAGDVKLSTHLQLVRRSRKLELYLHFMAIVLN
jgi:hypothetical protein